MSLTVMPPWKNPVTLGIVLGCLLRRWSFGR